MAAMACGDRINRHIKTAGNPSRPKMGGMLEPFVSE